MGEWVETLMTSYIFCLGGVLVGSEMEPVYMSTFLFLVEMEFMGPWFRWVMMCANKALRVCVCV